MKGINELCKECHEQAKKKKFYKNDEKFIHNLKVLFDAPEGFKEYLLSMRICQLLLLTISELTETMEADRENKYTRYDDIKYASEKSNIKDKDFVKYYESAFKDTFEDEIAGALIRILDLCGYLEIDIESHIKVAMRYNTFREPKHRKKY